MNLINRPKVFGLNPQKEAPSNSEKPLNGQSQVPRFSRDHNHLREGNKKERLTEGIIAFRAPVHGRGEEGGDIKYIPNRQIKRLAIDEKYMQKTPVEGWASTGSKGKVSGTQWQHTRSSMEQVVANADVKLPRAASGEPGPEIFKDLKSFPSNMPVVILMHGSGGPSAATRSLQEYLATQGIASVAPNSFDLQGRVTYQSPIDKAAYERIHEMRASELNAIYDAVKVRGDNNPIILIGTSEGSVAVSRARQEVAAKIICSYSAEPGYFTQEPNNFFPQGQPALNVISSTDPFFTTHNSFLGNPAARGDAADQFKSGDNRNLVVLVDRAPHTLINIPEVQQSIGKFIAERALRSHAATDV